MINGITELAMMKADVLDGFDTVKICTQYRIEGATVDRLPFDVTGPIDPIYESMPGWKGGGDIEAELERYIARVEKEAGVPVRIVSLGPDRARTIMRAAELAH
jgi:adenylosuccinate synthase